MDPRVDAYLNKLEKWQQELKQLRMILLECGLTEELKWGSPCYTFQKKNVAIVGGLKDNCVLSFFKGALLKDGIGILVQPGEHTQAARIVPFTRVREISQMKDTLKAYIFEAIELEKSGFKVSFKKNPEPVPAELEDLMKKNKVLKKAFEALTPGRQRAYILYFSAPKQSRTRATRVEKCMPRILKGKGLTDR